MNIFSLGGRHEQEPGKRADALMRDGGEKINVVKGVRAPDEDRTLVAWAPKGYIGLSGELYPAHIGR